MRKTVPSLGIEPVVLPGLCCCPDPAFLKSLHELDWLALAARNLAIAEEAGLDPVTICSGCTETLAEAAHLLNPGGKLLAQINERLAQIGKHHQGNVDAGHLMAALRDDVGYDAMSASVCRPLRGARVAVRCGCHLLKPRDIIRVVDPGEPTILEDMPRAIGTTPLERGERVICRGKSFQDCDLPEQMTRTILCSIHDADVDIMGVICPSCFDSFDVGQLRVVKKDGLSFAPPRSTSSSCSLWTKAGARPRWDSTSTSPRRGGCWRDWPWGTEVSPRFEAKPTGCGTIYTRRGRHDPSTGGKRCQP